MTRKVLVIFCLFISSIAVSQTTTVYFDFNSFLLDNVAKSTLDKFIASGKVKSVGFFGHTDQMGSPEANEWLSVQRALAVKDYLLSKGLKENEVSVVRGFGAERPVTKDPDPEFQQLNRRVSITNEYKPSPADLAAVVKQTPTYYTTAPTIKKQLPDNSIVSLTADTTTVYFDFNSFLLNDISKSTLDKFIASEKLKSVGFFGHTDQMGSAEANEWLSVQRALAVKDYLLSKGLKENDVSVVRGFGAERPVTKDPAPEFQKLNRRVSMTNEYKPSPDDLAAVVKQTPVYYTQSPKLQKQDSSQTTLVANNNQPSSNNQTKEIVETKETLLATQSNTELKQPVTNNEKKIATEVKDSATTTQTNSALKQPVANNQTKTITESKDTAAANQTNIELKQPVANSITEKTPLKDTVTTAQTNTEIKLPITNNQTSTIESKDTAATTQTNTELKQPVANNQSKITDKEKETSINETKDLTRQTPVQKGVKGEAKESFADRLSKAVNTNTPAKPSGTNEVKTPAGNAGAPVVKQQKHEKLIEDIKDKTTKEGEHIVLRHINFYGGRHVFLPQTYPALDDLLETMQKVPTLQIEIQGHICCQEGEDDQIDFDSGEPNLSVTRAKAVYDFLVDNGIDKSRMSYKGLAHKYPIIKVEANEEEATVNRRVEIKIIKK